MNGECTNANSDVRTCGSRASKILPYVKQCLMLANSVTSTLRIKQAVNTDAMILHPIGRFPETWCNLLQT